MICDTCGWPILTPATASGDVYPQHHTGGHVDGLRICERCAQVGPGVPIFHDAGEYTILTRIETP